MGWVQALGMTSGEMLTANGDARGNVRADGTALYQDSGGKICQNSKHELYDLFKTFLELLEFFPWKSMEGQCVYS